MYLSAAGFSEQTSASVKEGTWTPNPTAGPPAVVSLSPNTGAGTSVTFKAVYSDPNGAGDLSTLLLQMNTTQSGVNGCYVYYQPQGNHLYLANNAGAWITPALTPGVDGISFQQPMHAQWRVQFGHDGWQQPDAECFVDLPQHIRGLAECLPLRRGVQRTEQRVWIVIK